MRVFHSHFRDYSRLRQNFLRGTYLKTISVEKLNGNIKTIFVFSFTKSK
ncbi:hypothetical protein LEP1GSC059_2441 [Leptospira noguchii serovar Panama str. CZ214]|uniref:Uncharacterized protein n=1 Tax=Leptospira noguchii serovar Panama str. CZ214 TaxID=1001595 RepID=T0FHD1_9LEPT|nr:hypothetical protein LEP1GSC059_2441 [Leptospira noguchii serovar Panama str. CZ214]